MDESPTDRPGGREERADAARRALQVDIGRRIRASRIEMGVGQAECARAAGIDKSSMFRIESGGQNLTVETLARLAHAIGVSMNHLLAGVEVDPALIVARSRD